MRELERVTIQQVERRNPGIKLCLGCDELIPAGDIPPSAKTPYCRDCLRDQWIKCELKHLSRGRDD